MLDTPTPAPHRWNSHMTAWREDLKRVWDAGSGSSFQRGLWCWRTPGVHAMACYRFGRWLLVQRRGVRWPLELVYQLWFRHIRSAWGIEVNRGAVIGPGCYIVHFGGMFIAHPARIGRQVKLMQDVTIGQHGDGAPTIGDFVYLGPGAKLYGKITIGDHVKVGPNCVVHTDVPPYTTLVAPEPLVLSRGHANKELHHERVAAV